MLMTNILTAFSLISLAYGKAFIIENNFTAPAVNSSNLMFVPTLRLLFSFGTGSSMRGAIVRQAFVQTARRSALRMTIKNGQRIFTRAGKSAAKGIRKGFRKVKSKVRKGRRKLKKGFQKRIKKSGKIRKLFSKFKPLKALRLPALANFAKFIAGSMKKMMSFLMSTCIMVCAVLFMLCKFIC
jgi:hypothetical protein